MRSQKTNLRRAEQLMREQSKREKKTVGAFITACKGDDQSAVAPALNALLKAQAFEPALREACDLGIVPFATRCEILRCFHKSWSELYHLRDEPFVFDALGVLLPKYEGPSVRLYRGMVAEEWESKKYGFCWTSDPDIARQFAWGLEYLQNSSDHDRCVIETLAPESAIISSSRSNDILPANTRSRGGSTIRSIRGAARWCLSSSNTTTAAPIWWSFRSPMDPSPASPRG